MSSFRGNIDSELDNIEAKVSDIRQDLLLVEGYANQEAEQLDMDEIREMQSSIVETLTALKELEESLF